MRSALLRFGQELAARSVRPPPVGNRGRRILGKSAPLTRSTTASQVVRVIRERIISGEYKAGSFLRPEAFAQELGVSRIPVREALSQLEFEGFVVREQYRGYVIAELSLREIEEIYALRTLIEVYVLEQAIPRLTPEVLQEARELVLASGKCTDLDEWAELNTQFHKTLYQAADLPLMGQMLEHLVMRADRYFRLQRTLSAEAIEQSTKEHQHILDLICAGRGDEAIAALRKHINWNETDMRKVYESIFSGDAR